MPRADRDLGATDEVDAFAVRIADAVGQHRRARRLVPAVAVEEVEPLRLAADGDLRRSLREEVAVRSEEDDGGAAAVRGGVSDLERHAGKDVTPEGHRREVVGALVEPPAASVARDLVGEGHVCAAGDRDRRAARGVDVGPAARGVVRRGRFRRTPRELGQLGRFASPVRVDDRPHGGLVDADEIGASRLYVV